MATNQWFVVVSRKSAKLFEVNRKPDSLGYKKCLRNPLGAEKNKAMTTDKPGMSRGKFARSAPHALTRERDPHEDAAIIFSKKVSSFLKLRKEEKVFSKLTIAAEAHMLGLLKKAIKHDGMECNIEWLRKDLEKANTKKLEEIIFTKTK